MYRKIYEKYRKIHTKIYMKKHIQKYNIIQSYRVEKSRISATGKSYNTEVMTSQLIEMTSLA